jgi:hypothetical protein
VVNLDSLDGSRIRAAWFDPRTGKTRTAGNFPKQAQHTFEPPSSGRGNDWLLMIDTAAR